MPPKKIKDISTPCAEASFETRLQRLQEIVNLLESGERPLEEAIRLYQEGVMLSKMCQTQLDTAKHEIEILNTDGSLSPLIEGGNSQTSE